MKKRLLATFGKREKVVESSARGEVTSLYLKQELERIVEKTIELFSKNFESLRPNSCKNCYW